MFEDAFPIISTPDMERGLGLYRDLLDGVVEYQFPPEGERLRGAGVTVVEEPADQPWGERIARVLDPDGNEVIVGQRA